MTQVQLMAMTDSDKAKGMEVPIWKDYHAICDKHQKPSVEFEMVERFSFYERAKKAYAIIHTG